MTFYWPRSAREHSFGVDQLMFPPENGECDIKCLPHAVTAISVADLFIQGTDLPPALPRKVKYPAFSVSLWIEPYGGSPRVDIYCMCFIIEMDVVCIFGSCYID